MSDQPIDIDLRHENTHYSTLRLSIEANDSFNTCAGWAKRTKKRCTQPIKTNRSSNQANAQKLIQLSKAPSGVEGDEFRRILDGLANTLLCSVGKGHQGQYHTIYSALMEALRPSIWPQNVNTSDPTYRIAEPSVNTPTTKEVQKPTSTRPPLASIYDSESLDTRNRQAPRVSGNTASATTHSLVATPSLTFRDGFKAYMPKIRTKQQAEAHVRVKQGEFNEIPDKAGFVYAFHCRELEGLIKIGYTALKPKKKERRKKDDKVQQRIMGDEIRQRIQKFRSECRRDPIMINDPKQRVVHDVFRCEQLVFAELARLRLKEIKCKGHNGGHKEWFEVDEAKALEVIERARQYAENLHGVADESELRGQIQKNQNAKDNHDLLTNQGTWIEPMLSDAQEYQSNDGNSYRVVSVRTTPTFSPQNTVTVTAKLLPVRKTGKRQRFTAGRSVQAL